jgi:hypothetical protein
MKRSRGDAGSGGAGKAPPQPRFRRLTQWKQES